jgi:ABC-type enterochelin transport system ATPase subunit
MTETRLEQWIKLAEKGTRESIEMLMGNLNVDATLQETREIDYALSYVEAEEGVKTIKDYLFYGTQIQRNYCALYLGRMHEYIILREAYDLGSIDDIQAFSR